MKPLVALLAPGVMGAALAGRLTEAGLEVRTVLQGRSAATRSRAEAAGMKAVDSASIGEADIVLSVVPPAQAASLAEQLAPVLARSRQKPVYVDLNAISPERTTQVAATIAQAGCAFVDGSIIGAPPRAGYSGPVLYLSGPEAQRAAVLSAHGLNMRVLDAPIGAASALKMCYGAITKGLIAVGSAAVLAAMRSGVGAFLHDELAASQPQLLAGFERSIPDMLPKAQRWVAEMQEIAAFFGHERAEGLAYESIGRFYERIGEAAGEGEEIAALKAFLARRVGSGSA